METNDPVKQIEAAAETAPARRSKLWIPVTVFMVGVALIAALTGYIRRPQGGREALIPDETETVSTPAPTAEPTPGPTASPEVTPEPTEIVQTYTKTDIVVGGRTVLTMASREAAEELIKNVKRHFEDFGELPDNAVTEPETPIEFKKADENASTMSYDKAFSYLTGSGTPIVYISTASSFDDEPIPHDTRVRYDRSLPKGLQYVNSYGRDGIERKTITVTYRNGVRMNSSVKEKIVVMEPINSVITVGTLGLQPGEPLGRDFGTTLYPATELTFVFPADGEIIKLYGPYDDGFHNGIDIAAELGSEVRAACEGKVVSVLERGAYGLTVDIEHENGVMTRYARLSAAFVGVGSRVEAGTVIGAVGGNEYASWLHFELRSANKAYNPLKIMAEPDA